MPATPNATAARPNYPWVLSDGVHSVGLMHAGDLPAMQRVPRSPGVERQQAKQTTWQGGRGNEIFGRDTTRFFDSGAAWTMVREQLAPGPLMRWSKGYRKSAQLWPGDREASLTQAHFGFHWRGLYGAQQRVAQRFTPSASFDADKAQIIVRFKGTVAGNLYVSLYSETAGAPGTLLIQTSLAPSAFGSDWLAQVVTFDWTGVQALTGGTNYWIEVTDDGAPDANNHWQVGSGSYAVSGSAPALASAKTVSWAASDYKLYFRITDADAASQGLAHFYEYKRALYCATEPTEGTAGALYLNGDRGVCTGSQFDTKIVDSTKSWTTNEWMNAYVLVIRGPNRGQSRKILGNDGTSLTVSAWPTTPTTGSNGTEYVILGSDKWTLLTSGLTKPVKSVIVVNGIVYHAQGTAAAIRRMREYNNGGVWTRDFADDGSNQYDLLLVNLEDTGKTRIYAVENDNVKVYWSEVKAWGTALDFGHGHTQVGTSEAAVTNLLSYNNQVWLPKEDSIWIAQPNPLEPTKLTVSPAPVALRPARDERNGRAAAAWNTYFYFSFLDGLERLFGQVVDDIGPNRDAGLPPERRGRVADLAPVLSYMYTAWDGGDTRPSAILVTTNPGGAWHELYRGPSGQRIQSLFYQSVPDTFNRLWFSQGGDLCYLVMPDDTHNPLNDSAMLYTWESYWITSWFDLGSPELDHFYDQLRLFSEGLGVNLLGVGEHAVEVDVQTDTPDQDWSRFTTYFTESPYQKIAVFGGSVTGRRARFRLRLEQGVYLNRDIIILRALDLRANTLNEVLYDYLLPVRFSDRLTLLDGSDATGTLAEAIAQLEAWQEDATPLTLTSMIDVFNNLRGHIDPIGLAPTSVTPENTDLRGQIVFKQV